MFLFFLNFLFDRDPFYRNGKKQAKYETLLYNWGYITSILKVLVAT